MTKFYQYLGKCILAFSLGVLPALSAHASDSYKFQTVVGLGTGLSLPTDVAFAPGQTDRMYVTEFFAFDAGGAPVGRVSSVDLETGTRTTFLEVPGVELSPEGGVHSLAFHPDFETNGKFYLSWVISEPEFVGGQVRPAGRVDEYMVVGGVPTLQRTILELKGSTEFPIHGIADLNFDPTATGAARDYLYIGMGDGGPQANSGSYINRAQDLGQLYGKILRVGVDGADEVPGDDSRNYSIPSTNPYANDGDDDTNGAVWLSGLRNPWRFSFDRDSGDMIIGDVGFNTNEELNFVAAGESGIDFGWGQREGTIATPDVPSSSTWYTGLKGDSRDPFFEGNHDHPNHDTHGSIAGGFVYRGPIQELQGKYFFADTRTDKLFMLDFDPTTAPDSFDGLNYTNFEDLTAEALADLGLSTFEGTFSDSLVSFGEDASGNLYLANISSGEIYTIVAVPEPTSFVLVILGFVGFGTRRRKWDRSPYDMER